MVFRHYSGVFSNSRSSYPMRILPKIQIATFISKTKSNNKSFISKSRSKNSSSTNPDSFPPYKFGSYSPLNLPDSKSREGIAKLVDKITDFKELKIYPEIRDVLFNEIKAHTVLRSQNYMSTSKKIKSENELNGLIIRPTPIQIAAIKIINDKRDKSDFFKVFTLAAETGSGKTWAYLAPLLQQLLEGHKLEQSQNLSNKELEINNDGLVTESNDSPYIKHRSGIKSVILVPTHELVDQVYSTIEYASKQLNLNILKWDTDSNFKVFIENFKNGIDIMVTTPGKLNSLSKYHSIHNPKMIFGSISFCVADEADTLMDPSFIEETNGILKHMTNLSTLIFTSATVPSRFNKTISHLYPDVTNVSTPSLHKLPKSIEFRMINASVPPYKGSKMKALAQALYAIHCDGTEQGYEKRVIVFVNKKEDCEKIAIKLSESYGHDVTYITSEDSTDDRKKKVSTFVEPAKKLDNLNIPILKVLVCTDLLSRGLNFQGIRNVILLDVPKTSSDLVHRAGRTGRMNQSGRVFMIIDDSDKGHVKGLPKVLRNNRRLG
ncbi:RNA helicase [Pichia californica]|nr:RNA helicase [[Candida] californica]